MRLVDAEITDVLGARKMPIRFGRRLTIVAGANGTGKSTIRRAILATIAGGEGLEHLVNVHAGQEAEPAVVVRAEDGGRVHQFERVPKRVTAMRAVLDERGRPTAALEPVPQAAAWLRGLLPQTAVDVVELLAAKGERLATLILQACPLTMVRAQLLDAMGITEAELQPAVPTGLHPLIECGEVYDRVFSARQAVNRDEKSARQTADQLLRTIPKDIPTDTAEAVARIEGLVRGMERDIAATEARARAEGTAALEQADAISQGEEDRAQAAHKQTVRDLRAHHDAWAAEERAKVERAIAAAAVAMNATIEARRAETQARLEEIDAAREERRAAVLVRQKEALAAVDVMREELRVTSANLAQLREQDKRAALDRHTREQADARTAEADKLKAESARLTKALGALEAFRRGLAENLPIPGLSINGKEITVDGVPWEQLNEAQRVALLVRLVVLGARGSSLPLVIVDQAEKLVGENWPLLLRELAAADVQAIVCRAEPHPLTVVPIDDPAQLDAYLQQLELQSA
jgi:hypothetical protein